MPPLPAGQPTLYQSRLLNFFGTFAMEAASEDRVTFVECLLGPLVELTCARDATPRWRFCQLLHALVGNLPAEAELSDGVVDAFQEAMEERLEDAKPAVRAVAVRALARLPDPGDGGDFSACPLTRALLDMLAAEKSKAVRKAILATLPCSDFTRKVFVERTRDEADDVRRMAYMALAERAPLAAMPAADAAALLRAGLGDRAASVREAVASRLLAAWLEAVDGEPLRLIHALDVQAHTGGWLAGAGQGARCPARQEAAARRSAECDVSRVLWLAQSRDTAAVRPPATIPRGV